MNKLNSHKEVISEIKKLRNVLLEELEIKDISGLSTYGRKDEPLKSNEYFIIHHTAGRGNAERVVNILNNRRNKKTGKTYSLGVQYVIDREGKIFRTLPDGGRGAHILNSSDFASAPEGINNSNSQGVEVIANNDDDILPIQAVAALKLVKELGFEPSQIYGHGKINPGHKAATEGMTITNFIKKNYNKYIYDFSDFSGKLDDDTIDKKEIDKPEIDKKDPSKLEKFLDFVGIGDLIDIDPEDKESQKKFLDKNSSFFSFDDIIDTDKGIKIFGYRLEDVLDKVKGLALKLESKKEKKNILEDKNNIIRHKQVISEIKKIRNVLLEEEEEESSIHVNAKNAKSHLENLGYKVQSNLDEIGDITPELSEILKKIGSAFKQKMPEIGITFGSGKDDFHRKRSKTSRHNTGNANDVVFFKDNGKRIKDTEDEILDKISTLLCAARRTIPGFTFMDEYRHPSKNSTDDHFHLSYSENGGDEDGHTPRFCKSIDVSNLEDFEFPEVLDDKEIDKPKIDKKDPDKLEKFLDDFGISDLLSIANGDKESEKKLFSMIDDINIIDTDKGIKIFGYRLEDILDKVKGFALKFESQEKKKNLLEDIQKIKSKMIK
jgi:hypothetical protein